MINFALFGVGRIGELHAKNIFENKKSLLTCIYDTNLELAKKFAKKYKCEVASTSCACSVNSSGLRVIYRYLKLLSCAHTVTVFRNKMQYQGD